MTDPLTPSDFQLLFEATPHPYLVLRPDQDFTIVAVNDRYLAATGSRRDAILGRGLFEIFPDNPDDPSGSGTSELLASLRRVVADRHADVMGIQKYDIPRPDGSGEFEVKYWSPVNTPVFGADGEMRFITHHAEDITEIMLSPAGANQADAERVHAAQASAVRSEIQVLHQAAALKQANRELTSAKEELKRQTDEQLRRGEERYRALVQASSQALFRMSPDWSEMWQLQGGDFIAGTERPNRNWVQEYIHPDDRQSVLDKIGEAVRRETIFEFEHRVRRLDGSLGWTHSRAVPVRNRQGEIVEWFGAASDITERKRAEEQLRANEEKYRTLFTNMSEGFALGEPILDEQGRPVDIRYLEVNEAFYRHTGFPEDILGRPLRDFAPNLEQSWVERFAAVALTGKSDRSESYSTIARRHYDVRAFRPSLGRFAILFWDITDQKRVQFALQDSERRLALALSASGSSVWEMDVATRVVRGEDSLYAMLGYAPGELKTLDDWFDLVPAEDSGGLSDLVGDAIEGRREQYSFESRLRTKTGSLRWNLTQAVVAGRDKDGRAVRLVGTHTDITERKLAEQRIREVALHDPLTGLPNRALVFEYGSHLLAGAGRRHSHGALLFVDLDRFKPINDIYGHHTGDRVLQEVARRLVACTRHEDLVGRLGGDEFVILLPHLDVDRLRAATVAQHVLQVISQPFLIDALEISLSPSIGISFYPEHSVDVGGLIHAADLAMYQVKQSGRSSYQFYSPELDRQADEIYSLETRLKDALRHHRLALHYQPVVDIADGRLIGVEALVRLADNGILIGPASFIPVAESTGLIGDIGEWVLWEACRQHELWREEGMRVPIAVNVSPLQFKKHDFAETLKQVLVTTGVDPSCIHLEVTESAVMESLGEAIGILRKVKALGVKIALDDFGTGYSSLSRLASLPLDKLKVDQSFVRQIDSDSASRAVTEAIITLGRKLKLDVVGEGIESEHALRYLQAHGCNQAQGNWFSAPLTASQFTQWHRRHLH